MKTPAIHNFAFYFSFVALQACGSGEPGKDAPNTCVPGQSIACVCVNGEEGAQTCNLAGTYDPCACSSSASAGDGGEESNINTGNGGSGGNSEQNGDGKGGAGGASDEEGNGGTAAPAQAGGASDEAGNGGTAAPAKAGAASVAEKRPLEAIQAIEAGGGFTCALTSAGGVKCWGRNTTGQLGNRTNTNSVLPVDVFGLESGVVQVSVGTSHACAVSDSGTVQCWGSNQDGQLGVGQGSDSNYPIAVPALSQVESISLGIYSGCAHLTTGGLNCWGDLSTELLTTGVTSVSVGYEFSCVVLTSGPAQCAGDNSAGQLGNGTENNVTRRSSYETVLGLESGVKAIAAGGLFACALTDNGEVLCWGDNESQQLGGGSSASEIHAPVLLSSLHSITQIAAGPVNACALRDDGHVFCWGDNSVSQIGNGTQSDAVSAPAEVTGIDSAVQISVGAGHACALLSDGTARCWGAGGDGQLGNGTTNAQPTPVTVLAE